MPFDPVIFLQANLPFDGQQNHAANDIHSIQKPPHQEAARPYVLPLVILRKTILPFLAISLSLSHHTDPSISCKVFTHLFFLTHDVSKNTFSCSTPSVSFNIRSPPLKLSIQSINGDFNINNCSCFHGTGTVFSPPFLFSLFSSIKFYVKYHKQHNLLLVVYFFQFHQLYVHFILGNNPVNII